MFDVNKSFVLNEQVSEGNEITRGHFNKGVKWLDQRFEKQNGRKEKH